MNAARLDTVKVGDDLPPLTLPAITRTTLALFAGASGDHNPIHIDFDYAKAFGMPDVFAQGMLPMAYLGRLLTIWSPQSQLRQFKVRFSAMTPVGARLTCFGKVVEKLELDSEVLARLEIAVSDEHGVTKLVGEALVALA
ncbi:MaoC family dehydratase [Aquabacterium sp. CECT 9606]|uniref:MaoC family dehydratase n=1 Tax=Aquabacterium sp. CECT 9606 TaxID=2845822 RepID=UPI001E4B3475|nr:MaoC family dehydratase [Aquabacterium sp. CECT 9606]CAH0353251.1 hypothetical protein AQB9606_03137 [Aquabacterium sp. CECT 9606]